MSAANSRRAPPQGGLARLVSKFENLGASSKSARDDGATYESPGHAFVDANPTKVPSTHKVQDGAETLKAATPPSPAPVSVSPTNRDDTAQSASAAKDIHIAIDATLSLKPKRPLARSGSVVADMRRLFERGSVENTVSNIVPATYEPKRGASPTTNEYNEQNVSSCANSCAKGSSKTGVLPTDAGDLEELDLQEGKDAVPDLIPFHVEHPECLPRPLASPDRSSRRSEESKAGAKSKTSVWQRGTETRFKLQGGAFQHKTPSPLKNMIVTGIGAWYPKAGNTLAEEVPRLESEIMKNDAKDAENFSLSRRAGAKPDVAEHSLPDAPLQAPCQDAESLPTAHTTSDPKKLHQLKSPSLKTSRSVPSQESKRRHLRTDVTNDKQPFVQNEMAKPDSTSKFSPKPSLRLTRSGQAPARYTSRVDGSLPAQSMATAAKRGLEETIGLFESMSHQTDGEGMVDYIPKAYTSPDILQSGIPNGSPSQQKHHGQMAAKAWDVTPTPRLLSPLESRAPRSYSRSPSVDTIRSQASDVKPLLYTKPSTLKASRHRRGLGSILRPGWRRKVKTSSEDAGPHGHPEPRRGFNVDGEGGFDLQSQHGADNYEEMSESTCESFPVKHRLSIIDRHPSLRLLGRRFISRSHGLFVSQAHCPLQQPQPVRGGELRRITSLCKDRMAAFRARPQTE
ncbi:hypothetical protein MKX08_007079 [Trichoderma sp. CBMAI-0020]|nr:hypothetical protein MKX08_007079 [Trichoderma sp. CBMAI-0020]WOD46576.1 hypothetical protein [Trichoderma atroviride]